MTPGNRVGPSHLPRAAPAICSLGKTPRRKSQAASIQMSGSHITIIATFNIYGKMDQHINSPKNCPLASPHPRNASVTAGPAVGHAQPGVAEVRGQRARFEAECLS